MKHPKMSLSKTVFSPKCHLPNAEKPSNYGLFCSNAVRTLAPRRSKLRIACSDFFQKSERARSAAPPFKIEPTSLGFNFVLFGFISVNAVRTPAPLRRALRRLSNAVRLCVFQRRALFSCRCEHHFESWMRCIAAQIFEQRVIIYFYRVAALYDEFDAVLI